jgi:hypothetical protein
MLIGSRDYICFQGYYELKKHTPWFDEGYSELLYRSKQARLEWLQAPSDMNGKTLNSVRREVSRIFWNEELEYLKDEINE